MHRTKPWMLLGAAGMLALAGCADTGQARIEIEHLVGELVIREDRLFANAEGMKRERAAEAALHEEEESGEAAHLDVEATLEELVSGVHVQLAVERHGRHRQHRYGLR